MSKIFEALQQAQAERMVRDTPTPGEEILDLVATPATVCTVRPLGLEREMLRLAHAIESRLGSHSKKVVQFIGSEDGEGTATIAREFAWTMARQSGRPVLLVDGNPMQLEHHRAYALQPGLSLDLALRERDVEDSLRKVPASDVYLAAFSKDTIQLPKHGSALNGQDPWGALRERFAFILVSSPPIHHSAAGLNLCSRVDGVVLVLEAESTSAPVVRNVRDHIRNAGGNLLGAVFNKQRHYIPDWIYSRL
jgi:Mrp family chromosome partitioning ATPase